MANTKTRRTSKKKTGKQGRPGGNPDLEKYKWKPEVAGKPKRNLLPVKVDDDMFRVKQLPNWQDRVRAKIEELLQEEAIAQKQKQTYPTGGGAGSVIR